MSLHICDRCGRDVGPTETLCAPCLKVTAAGRGSGKSSSWPARPVSSFSSGENMSIFTDEGLAKRDARMIKAGLDEAAAAVQQKIAVYEESYAKWRESYPGRTELIHETKIDTLKRVLEQILKSGSAAVDRYYREHEEKS